MSFDPWASRAWERDEPATLPPVERAKPTFDFSTAFLADRHVADLVSEHVVEVNRQLLQKWTGEILPNLPDPPEGMAWFPNVEIEPADVFDVMANTITYRIRPELRDV